jgi:hypothetical protein
MRVNKQMLRMVRTLRHLGYYTKAQEYFDLYCNLVGNLGRSNRPIHL